jgi:hypothetical protein
VLLAAALVGSFAVGCTEYEPASDTLELVGLSAGGSGSLAAAPPGQDWSCLDQPVDTEVSAPVFAGAAPQVIYSMQMVDLSSGAIYRNLQVRACALTDVNCANPLTGMLGVNEQGRVDIPLFQNFTGYLEITSDELVPQLFYVNEPLQPRTGPDFPLAMLSLSSLGPLVQLIGVDIAPATGFIGIRVFDCQGDTAIGVSLDSDTDAVPWYLVDGLPSSIQEQTGREGLAGFLNYPPGLAVLRADAPDGTALGIQSMVIRPGWMSSMYVRPPGVQTFAP